MQYADGTSPITYTVTGSIAGRRVTMTSYTIKALVPEWTVTPDPLSSTNNRTGKITSTNSAKSKMGVYYGERELARSTNEIAFAKVDLIVSPGPGTNGGTPLPEDRQPAGGTAPATNELNPGTFVLLYGEDQTNRVATTLTLKADPTGGSVTLDQHGLTDLKIYTDEALHEELTLPKTWTYGDTPPSTLYMVGSSSSTNLQSAQGTLDLTYKTTLAADGIEQSIKDTVGVNLLPIELVDINDHANTGDDLAVQAWYTTKPIADSNIAWIDAHTSDQNPAPRMPQLEFRMPGLPQGMTIEAKLEVKYDRGNGARTGRNQAEDTVKIPSDGNFKQVSGDTWQIWSEYQNEDFFGGDAKLTYRLKSGSTEILPATTINFRIGGKNPDDARCRAYIETLPDAGPNGGLWFAYAIAKSESKDYNGQGSRYNQFLELSVTHRGRPLFGDDPSGPGGYGLFQVTGNAASATADIPRKQIWNWQENIIACMDILRSKRTTAVNWMAQQRNATNANGVALPNHTVRAVTFAEGASRTMEDAVTIKLYNGASRASAGFVDNGNVQGFRLDPQGSGQYCFWRHSSSEWALSRYNVYSPPFNYVDRVCAEVEP